MPTLDLSRFGAFATSRLTPEELETVRYTFADTVCSFALGCRNNKELLNALFLACNPHFGMPTPSVLGEGSTRRAWSLPFDLVMKLERTDDLTPAEMKTRGRKDYLYMRRRTATIGEVVTGIVHPRLMVRMYGVALSFGNPPPNPSVHITERVTPLDEIMPDEWEGIPNVRLFESWETGELLISDKRFVDDLAFGPVNGRPLSEIFPGGEPGTWIGNIGKDDADRFCLIDGGNHNYGYLHNKNKDYLPTIKLNRIEPWRECNALSVQHKEQTARISKEVFGLYRETSARTGAIERAEMAYAA